MASLTRNNPASQPGAASLAASTTNSNSSNNARPDPPQPAFARSITTPVSITPSVPPGLVRNERTTANNYRPMAHERPATGDDGQHSSMRAGGQQRPDLNLRTNQLGQGRRGTGTVTTESMMTVMDSGRTSTNTTGFSSVLTPSTTHSITQNEPMAKPSSSNSNINNSNNSNTTPSLKHQAISRTHQRRTSSINSVSSSSVLTGPRAGTGASTPLSLPTGAQQPNGTGSIIGNGSTLINYDQTTDLESPLSVIAKRLNELPESQRAPVRRTLEQIQSNVNPSHIIPQQNGDENRTRLMVDDQQHTQSENVVLADLDKRQSSRIVLPLDHSWTLFFSDTSAAAKTPQRSHHHHGKDPGNSLLGAAEYQSGMSEVFSGVSDVEALCLNLIGFKKKVGDEIRRGGLSHPSSYSLMGIKTTPGGSGGSSSLDELVVTPGRGLGLVVMKAQQNLHFFRVGVNPVWEDPWNAKGGRITLGVPSAMLDPTFESVVLLLAGGVLEHDAAESMKFILDKNNNPVDQNLSKDQDREGNDDNLGGRIAGVVGSRRSRGDRIEIWLTGPTVGSSPRENWIKKIQIILAREIGTSEARNTRYKKHLS